MKIRIGVTIDDTLLVEFRQACDEDKTPVSAVVNELIKWYLERREADGRKGILR